MGRPYATQDCGERARLKVFVDGLSDATITHSVSHGWTVGVGLAHMGSTMACCPDGMLFRQPRSSTTCWKLPRRRTARPRACLRHWSRQSSPSVRGPLFVQPIAVSTWTKSSVPLPTVEGFDHG